MCILVKQLLFLRQNEPKKRSQNQERFVANSQQGGKKCDGKKGANYLLKISEDLNVKLPGTHYPPLLTYSRTATYLEGPEVEGVQGSETWPR